MKKLIALAALALTCVAYSPPDLHAQTSQKMRNTTTPDTLINADTTYLVAKVPSGLAVTFQLNIKKVSGTVAGTAVLQASLDDEFTPAQWLDVGSSYTITNGDQATAWKDGANYLHYRIRVITTGTQRSIPSGFYYLRR